MFTHSPPDWPHIIATNRDALKRVLAQLVATLAAYGGLDAARLPRLVHTAITQVLRPAESALRRLIVIAAKDLPPEPAAQRPFPQNRVFATSRSIRSASFQLFDTRKRFTLSPKTYTTLVPKIWWVDPRPPLSPLFPLPQRPPEPPPDTRINALQLCLSLKAMASALDDIQRQAKRLVRLQARRARRVPSIALSPLRIGKPPGYSKGTEREIDLILAQCHNLARTVTRPDTS